MIEVEVNTDAVQGILANLIALGANMTPITRALAGVLADIPERAFANQADPVTGQAWAPLSPTTVARRGSATPILQVSGLLAASIHSEYGPDFALAGTADVKAPTHQFGAKKAPTAAPAKAARFPGAISRPGGFSASVPRTRPNSPRWRWRGCNGPW